MKSESLVGVTIAGKYRIEEQVGQGAMGAVYRARQIALDTTLALKVLHRPLASDPMFAARFLREAQAASRVDHKGSIRVLDFGEEPDGLLYIAMEYVDGKTLAQIIEDESPLPVARIVDIASQALAALAVAHDLGVIHRDLKPENIMVVRAEDDEGRTRDLVKVCDFGVAKLREDARAAAPSVTAQGMVVGTPEYMSPEQARGDELDARSDIYAMGVLLFHMMTGKVPFDSSTAFGTALMHVNDEPTRPRLLNPKASARLERICLKAMRKKPEHRHGSARELRAELRDVAGHDRHDEEENAMSHDDRNKMQLDNDGIPASLLAQIENRPRRGGVVIAALVLGATLAGGVYLHGRSVVPAAEPVAAATVTSAPLPSVPAAPVAPPALAPSEAAAMPAKDDPVSTDKGEKGEKGEKAAAALPRAHGPRTHARRSGVGAKKGEASARGGAIAIGEEATAADAKGKAVAPGAATPAAKGDAGRAVDAKKPEAAKPTDAKPTDGKPTDGKASDAKPEAAKPAATKPADPKKPAADPADAPLPDFPVPGAAAAPKPAEPAAPKPAEPAAPKGAEPKPEAPALPPLAP